MLRVMQVGDSPTPLFVTLTQKKQGSSRSNSGSLSSSLPERSASGPYPLYPQMSGQVSGMLPHNVPFYPGKCWKRFGPSSTPPEPPPGPPTLALLLDSRQLQQRMACTAECSAIQNCRLLVPREKKQILGPRFSGV